MTDVLAQYLRDVRAYAPFEADFSERFAAWRDLRDEVAAVDRVLFVAQTHAGADQILLDVLAQLRAARHRFIELHRPARPFAESASRGEAA